MGSLRTYLLPDRLVQLSFPVLRDLPLNHCTEPIVVPKVGLTKLPATDGGLVANTDSAPVLSPSQVRCFLDCPARWWFK
jgi:hypothetical protein